VAWKMRTDKKRQFAEMRQLTQLAVSNQLAQEYRRVSVKSIQQYRARLLKSIAKCVPNFGNLDTLNRWLSVWECKPVANRLTGFLYRDSNYETEGPE